ncbi:hypothetical protein [Chitinophaga polysaccharea]|uniref:hypothetical protein n=1 Tax=Chitinophaga polysaccharea TaxID=1293035 RepID=UPI00163CBBB6|nr:hypothetical protein [Chitinophaga polysaccharea]
MKRGSRSGVSLWIPAQVTARPGGAPTGANGYKLTAKSFHDISYLLSEYIG